MAVLSIKQYWPQNLLLLCGTVLCKHVVVPSSIITVASCSLSVGWTDLVMRAPCALLVSYGAVGPNWMTARLPQPSLLIILITLTQIRAGCWDLSTTHKGHGLLSAQLALMKKKGCVQQWMCLSPVLIAWWCLHQTSSQQKYKSKNSKKNCVLSKY